MKTKGTVLLKGIELQEERHLSGVRDNGWCSSLGRKVIPLGNGWGVIPRSYVATISIDDIEAEIPLEKYFRKHVGSLTKKRCRIIEETAPSHVDINKEAEFTITDQSLFDWSEKVLVILKLKRKV